MATIDAERTAAAAAAIRHHYDIGNEFYRLWLDPTLSYSCALRQNADDTLEIAQAHKLRHHLDAVEADRARSVLDIGCGWGAILNGLAERGVGRSVGLTLSAEQAEYVQAQRYPGVEVRVQDWLDYRPRERFDGIISVGAFEHFARPDDSPEQKIGVYREFLTRCRDWLTPDGALSLQTIAYANMHPAQANSFMTQQIFPDAELPTLAEITAAAQGLFEVCAVTNGRLDYAWTCAEWARRLRSERAAATELVGAEAVARYERYLKLSAMGFRMGKLTLYRLVLRPYRTELFGARGDRAS
ncbi:cyclopropane-fatty-acyl-phospholipid synthase family protein [Nocardia sp. NBC_01503]|uniref:cyclopropane-fatty-acyl-phospholipid synthase family protein n=1 Tax=Nocardia sp. NBC_01503 TaxID=2975997 RepID=UPI002E7BE13F|nr:cyclopropane-fatty-acyl-phospholipid synthase family protein [Nocardia sp. NBC_01503]WTL32194.1 cyclopropane-fatty-acyl-phospholipid synthase family protein [Nocardia sp. NBC_01503]